MLALTMSAQSFDALWKQYETAKGNDQPRSALASLRKIEEKARKEARYGHFIAAMSADIVSCSELSPDSVKVREEWLARWERSCRGNLSTMDKASEKVRRNAVASLVSAVLLSKYGDNDGEYSGGRIEERLDSVMKIPSLMEILTETDASLAYVPFVKREEHSSYFNHDLLSIICMEIRRPDLLQRYYDSIGNRKAACIAATKLSRLSAAKIKELFGMSEMELMDSLIARYCDLQECGWLAVEKTILMRLNDNGNVAGRVKWIDEALSRWPDCKSVAKLQNERMSMTRPQYTVEMRRSLDTPNHEQVIHFRDVRNISSIRITVTPLKCSGMADIHEPEDAKCYARIKPLMDKSRQKSFVHPFDYLTTYEDYEILNDSIGIGTLPVGVYLLEFSATSDYRASAFKPMEPSRRILCISDLNVLSIAQTENKNRYVVVNATTGQPVPRATLHIGKWNSEQFATYTTDDNGECIVSVADKYVRVYATTASDKASFDQSLNNNYYFNNQRRERHYYDVFTDRSLYRPGQKVQMSVVCHVIGKDNTTAVEPNKTVVAMLRDTEYEVVATDTLTTDEYGCAATEFTLPKGARNGHYSITAGEGNVGFSVEEYVRPTFEVTMDKPDVAFVAGDTITVTGKAKAYSGASVADAKVAYTIRRSNAWWWRRVDSNTTLLTDTVKTDANGNFTLRMPMVMPEETGYFARFYNITAEAVVTTATGETHSAMLSLPLSNRATMLTADVEERYRGEDSIRITINRYNAAGRKIDGKVNIRIDDVPKMTVDANSEFMLPRNIKSGKHILTAICDRDTLESRFYVFRLSDKTPAFFTHDWFYADAEEFPEDGGKVAVQIGSCDKDVHIVYTVAADGKVLENGRTQLSNSNITRYFTYKPEYGDGITLAYAWTKDGETYTHRHFIKRPLPSRRLHVSWKTFRNKLVPGQQEQWQMTVKDDNGNAVKSMLTATMYDKSLDAIRKHSWDIMDYRVRRLVQMGWNRTYHDRLYVSQYANYTYKQYEELKFSCFDSGLWDSNYGVFDCVEQSMSVMGASRNGEIMKAMPMMMSKARTTGTADMKMTAMAVLDSHTGDGVEESEATTEVMPRSNFAETAFFLPQLVTDDNGVATLSFTLPESVTTWRIMAFAHDRQMRYGMLTDEAVAQKQLMVQPRMPRFLRVGDKAVLAAAVSNLSEMDINTNVTMMLLDARTEAVVSSETTTLIIKSGETQSITFPVEGFDDSDLICKVTAEGNGFSDGEQHLLPILSEKPEEVDTMPVVVNPTKMMMEALPAMRTPEYDNAISLTSAYYANIMTAFMKDSLAQYDGGALLGKLQALQNTDGSLSWFKGMEGSLYITVETMKMLSRLNEAVGRLSPTAVLMNKAFQYLQKEMDRQVSEMKKAEQKKVKPHLTATQLDWLYAITLEKRDGGNAAVYLRKLIAEDTNYADMMTKSVAAMVLDASGKGKQADTFAESIKQHTVYREDMGRYFDSYRARYSWCSYRIPTQTMAIEALQRVTPEDGKTIAEMQRWLVSSKRTQRWDSPIDAVNAIYAFRNAKDTTVTATYVVKQEDIKDAISVKREVVKKAMVGDKVKVRITITADRDYDFVTVTDNRPACLEPVEQISGYHRGYYQEMRDNMSLFHFDKMHKGTHTIETEYFVERQGTYSSGTVTAVCTYAPEFRGTAAAYRITTNKE